MASSARLDELKKKFDENPRRYFAPLANEHRKSGDLDQAIALCRTHLPLQPGHISGHIVLAQALFEAGSLDESREIFHTALGLDPENLIALRYLGDIAKESADVETARQWYHRVLEVDPRNDEIIQLVRDLDGPASAHAPPSEEGQAAPVPTAAPASASYAPPRAPSTAESDARFAPLSLDDLDVGDAPTPTPNDSAAPAAGAAPAEWDAGAEAADLSLLDTTGIDPFDLDPAGSVDALLDAQQPGATEDFFLTELAGSNAPTDGGEEQPDLSEAAESSAPQASAAPERTEAAAEAETTFEEDSFYLEPPPPEPTAISAESDRSAAAAQSDAAEQSAVDRQQVSMPGLDAFAAEYSLPEPDPQGSPASAGWATSEPEPAPNAEALARFAEQETAEWHSAASEPTVPAAQAPDDGLGLEVMEFVPPSREPSGPSASQVPAADADPIIGRMLDTSVAEEGATPAAFVTETMAELYLQQGFRNEALSVYRELLARNPSDASLRDRIDQIESGSLSSIGMASVSENVVESALKRQSARPARSVRSFFASLAGRRAPGPRDVGDSFAADSPVLEPEAQLDESAQEMSYDATQEPQVDEYAEMVLDAGLPAESERVTPVVSAAETLATFDPFADAVAPAPPQIESPPDAPNETAAPPTPEPIDQLDATDLGDWAAPTVELPVAQPKPAAPASETAPSPRSLEDLFPETPVTARTEAAAQTFATAFGRSEPQGRPTRAASNELSLDNVFRGTPEGASPTDGGFSFDQFFSDSRTPGGDVTAPAATAQEAGRTNGSGDAHDIEQFTAWLEGLKKK